MDRVSPGFKFEPCCSLARKSWAVDILCLDLIFHCGLDLTFFTIFYGSRKLYFDSRKTHLRGCNFFNTIYININLFFFFLRTKLLPLCVEQYQSTAWELGTPETVPLLFNWMEKYYALHYALCLFVLFLYYIIICNNRWQQFICQVQNWTLVEKFKNKYLCGCVRTHTHTVETKKKLKYK